MSKERLELEKLQAEVAKLNNDAKEGELRIDHWANGKSFETWKLIPTYLGVSATLAVVTVQSCEYFDQRRNEQQFKVDAQMIELAEKLADPDNERLQRTAALQLVHFGEPAVRTLIQSIDFLPSEPVLASTCRALAEVALKSDAVAEVITLLEDALKEVADRELGRRTPIFQTITVHTRALTRLASRLLTDSPRRQYSELRERIRGTLKEIGDRVSEAPQDSDDKKRALKSIDHSRQTLRKLNSEGESLRNSSDSTWTR